MEGSPVASADVAADLAGISLFADLSPAQLEKVASSFEEQWFQSDERALREGFVGSNFYVILSGEALWMMGGEAVDRTATMMVGTKPLALKRGDFFGELSLLFDEPSISDVVATTPLHCLALPGDELKPFLLANPQIMYRVLEAEARRLRDPMRWR
nr:cyclic nucleotide-binding domain-containing protein [Actinomycetota bacterium]